MATHPETESASVSAYRELGELTPAQLDAVAAMGGIGAARQLRGQCGHHQVEGPEVAVWANAVGLFRDAMLRTAA